MSIIYNLTRVSQEQLETLQAEPETIENFLYENEDLIGNCSMDLDKSWHAIHYLFTGTDRKGNFPEAFLLEGGNTIGIVDVGYGPARSFSAEEANQIASYLKSASDAELRRRLNLPKMASLELYPFTWEQENEEDVWSYIHPYLQELRTFITTTACNEALLIYCN